MIYDPWRGCRIFHVTTVTKARDERKRQEAEQAHEKSRKVARLKAEKLGNRGFNDHDGEGNEDDMIQDDPVIFLFKDLEGTPEKEVPAAEVEQFASKYYRKDGMSIYDVIDRELQPSHCYEDVMNDKTKTVVIHSRLLEAKGALKRPWSETDT
ncbi:hypothetical protein TGAM01_v210982 [Trichoderma gamsii]|uniref:Uncharacterized protein n=1 Tax=Trichoderma gamsii TaxID=398673 RepID=A0A2P4Z7B6_9HYPO|nr:hypothetical protein TGAM01_v210982 [Trichoderma gamsii]PON20160.1 hypothetical protein TGAM01_v210982 [Trichoderma gamsii]